MTTYNIYNNADVMNEDDVKALTEAFGTIEGYTLTFYKDQWDRPFPVVSNGKDEYCIKQEWRTDKYVLELPRQCNRREKYPDSPNRIGAFTKKKLDAWFAVAKEYERMNDAYEMEVMENKAKYEAKKAYYLKKFGKAEERGKPGVIINENDPNTFYLYRGGLEIYFTCKDTFIDMHADFYYKVAINEETIMQISDNAFDMTDCNNLYDDYFKKLRKAV